MGSSTSLLRPQFSILDDPEDMAVMLDLHDDISPSPLSRAEPLDLILHALSFLDLPSLISVSLVSQTWNKAAYNPNLPQWRTLDLYSIHNRVNDRILARMLKHPRFRMLSSISLPNCTEITAQSVQTLLSLRYLLSVDFSNCNRIDLSDPDCKNALQHLSVYAHTIDLYLCDLGSPPNLSITDQLREINRNLQLGRFQFQINVQRQLFQYNGLTCDLSNRSRCEGPAALRPFFSNQISRIPGNILESAKVVCEGHWRNVPLCRSCSVAFIDETSWSHVELVCKVCFDRRLLAEPGSWVPLRSLKRLNDTELMERRIHLCDRKNIPFSMRYIGSTTDVTAILSTARHLLYNRCLLITNDSSVDCFADDRPIADWRRGGHLTHSLSQQLWRCMYSYLVPFLVTWSISFLFIIIGNDLENASQADSSAEQETGTSFKASKNEARSWEYLLVLLGTMLVVVCVVVVCIWRCRRNWQRIAVGVLVVDFLLILVSGLFLMGTTFSVWSRWVMDRLSIALVAWNVAVVVLLSVMYSPPGGVSKLFWKVQKCALVCANCAISVVIALTLPELIVVVLLGFPVALEVFELCRRDPRLVRGYAWLFEGHFEPPNIVYNVKDTVSLRSVDFLWVSLMLVFAVALVDRSLLFVSLISGSVLVMSSYLVVPFVFPFFNLNVHMSPLLLGFTASTLFFGLRPFFLHFLLAMRSSLLSI